jgi:hypothetical protein
MMRGLPLRHWYPSMVKDHACIDTKSFGKVFVGFELKSRIDISKNKLRMVL